MAVGLFEGNTQTHQAAHALADLGLGAGKVGLLTPDGSAAADSDVSALLTAAAGSGDVTGALTSMGVPEGEARFYASEVQAGRSLLVAQAGTQYDAVREVLLRHGGYDVQSRGGDLARPTGAGIQGGTGARPIDVTGRWEDVASRYEMLWGQHYGTSDATWEQAAPIYRYAWEAANNPRYRGRPWADVESAVRQDWGTRAPGWDLAAGPIRDVWEDVAEEAAMGAEGGRDRRIPRQGGDQEVAARDLSLQSDRGVS